MGDYFGAFFSFSAHKTTPDQKTTETDNPKLYYFYLPLAPKLLLRKPHLDINISKCDLQFLLYSFVPENQYFLDKSW